MDLDKPFDNIIKYAMENTLLSLCKETQDCIFGYTQSDEITIIIYNSDRYNDHIIYNGRKEKLCSILASRVTRLFNKYFYEYAEQHKNLDKLHKKLWEAEFDCKVFNIPEWDCINNIIFRQSDLSRNSVSSVGRAYYSHKELNGIKSDKLKEMLLLDKGVNFDKDYCSYYKNGTACVRVKSGDRYKFKLLDNTCNFKDDREKFKIYTNISED